MSIYMYPHGIGNYYTPLAKGINMIDGQRRIQVKGLKCLLTHQTL